ncbi:MAG: carbohydrate-binding domain-containing protein [Prevotella sp.]|nr:carbohydrate-binding domain-containing protein [Prevotella sp.]
MKRISILTLMAAALLAFTACSPDSDSYTGIISSEEEETDGNVSDTGSTTTIDTSNMLGNLSSLSISVDSTSLAETESIPADDEDYLENNSFPETIYIYYNGTSASYEGDVAGVSININGADVTVTSTTKGVNYVLSGAASDGMFKMATGDNDKKFQLTLNGLYLRNADGPAINIQAGKRCYVTLADGTFNYLTDGSSYASSSEDQKATLFSEGKLLFNGKGSLRVIANAKNGIASDDYLLFRPGVNVYVKSTANHAIKSNDGIFIRGGVINAETSATAAKGFKTDARFEMEGGRVTAITSGGGEYDSDDQDVSAAAGVKADSTITINGGSLYCRSTGKGGKGISTDQEFIVNDGTVMVITTGQTYTYSSRLDSKAKGIKSDGNMTVNGGHVIAKSTGGSGSEAIESKGTLTINDGIVESYAYDDAINSASHLYIKGGIVNAYSTGNDGIDANGNLYFQGGTTLAYGSRAPECGIDANEEGGYTVYISGGTILSIGGGNSTPGSSQSTQPYISTTGTFTQGGTARIVSGSTTMVKITTPYAYSGGSVLASIKGMTVGSTYTLLTNSSSASASAQQYGSGGMQGGGGMPGGRR